MLLYSVKNLAFNFTRWPMWRSLPAYKLSIAYSQRVHQNMFWKHFRWETGKSNEIMTHIWSALSCYSLTWVWRVAPLWSDPRGRAGKGWTALSLKGTSILFVLAEVGRQKCSLNKAFQTRNGSSCAHCWAQWSHNSVKDKESNASGGLLSEWKGGGNIVLLQYANRIIMIQHWLKFSIFL